MRAFACRLLLQLTLLAGFSLAADLTSSGDWVESITASHLTAGAGSDLQAKFESVAGVTTLTIFNTSGSWTLRARRGGNPGHPNVAIHVKRTSNGAGSGSIAGGTSYLELSTSDAELCSGSGDRSGIALQVKLTGLNRTVSPATYLSSLIFTVQ